VAVDSFGGFGGSLFGGLQKNKGIEEKNAINSTSFSFSANPLQAESKNLKVSKPPTPKTPKTSDSASELGLVAVWSRTFGYVSIHDPVFGEWHDVPVKEAPSWAKWEAGKRKELRKSGNKRAYRLTAKEIQEVWESEQVEVRGQSTIDSRGIVYEDYIEEGPYR